MRGHFRELLAIAAPPLLTQQFVVESRYVEMAPLPTPTTSACN